MALDELKPLLPSVDSEKRTKILWGLVRATKALKKVLTGHILQIAFEKIGIHPFNINQPFNMSKAHVSVQDYNAITSNLDLLVADLREHGIVLESTMDRIGLPRDLDGLIKSRDELVLYRQRASILNNKQLREWNQLYKYERDVAPQIRKEEKERQKASIKVMKKWMDIVGKLLSQTKKKLKERYDLAFTVLTIGRRWRKQQLQNKKNEEKKAKKLQRELIQHVTKEKRLPPLPEASDRRKRSRSRPRKPLGDLTNLGKTEEITTFPLSKNGRPQKRKRLD